MAESAISVLPKDESVTSLRWGWEGRKENSKAILIPLA